MRRINRLIYFPPEVFLWLLPIDNIKGPVLSISRSPARSFKKAKLCHQFGSRSAHSFDHEAPSAHANRRKSGRLWYAPRVTEASFEPITVRRPPSTSAGARFPAPVLAGPLSTPSLSGGTRFATCQFPFDELELAAAASGHSGQGIPMDAWLSAVVTGPTQAGTVCHPGPPGAVHR